MKELPERVRVAIERKRSNAGTTHGDRRLKRRRDRSSRERRAIAEAKTLC